MTIKGIKDLLAEHAFFSGMPKEHLELLSGCAKNVVFQPGAIVARTGDEAKDFYMIRSGNLAIELYTAAQGPMTIQTLGEGTCAGWSWIFPPYRWQFDVRALELVHAVGFDGVCLREKCQSDPVLGYEFLKRFSKVAIDRMQATRLQLLDIYGRRSDDTASR